MIIKIQSVEWISGKFGEGMGSGTGSTEITWNNSVGYQFCLLCSQPDSDGDLIPDGRERYYNTDATKPDPIDTDDDNDGLNTLDEQIHNTDPK